MVSGPVRRAHREPRQGPEFRKRTQTAQDDPQTQITSSRGLYDIAVEF
ncbi:hypothetical protein OG530_00610 [Streptomyces decoyicus]